jgi:4'-phosphopantetheinyl transferase
MRPADPADHPFGEGEIHIWLAPLVEDERRTEEFFPLLDRGEVERAARFSYRRLRSHFVQSHGIVRRILAGYAGVDPADVVFTRSRFGKPRLVAPASASRLHFSLSHSGDFCILAVRLGQPLGVDIEQLKDHPLALGIARRHFTAAETRMLAGLRGDDRRDGFFALWTRKEAVVKAMGASLAGNIGGIEFAPDGAGQPALVALDGDRSRTRGWFVLGLDVTPGYVAALATVHPFRELRHFTWNGLGPARACNRRNNRDAMTKRRRPCAGKSFEGNTHRMRLYNTA